MSVCATTDWSSVLERAALSVVLVMVELDEGGSQGSGALISQDGYILTAQHVIEGAVGIDVYVPNVGVREAQLIDSSAEADIAVLKIEGEGFLSLPLGDSDDLKLEQEIRLLGYPQQAAVGVGLIIGRGVFLGSRVPIGPNEVKLIQIDVSPFDHGHSGGPVINGNGEIVGVAVRTVRFLMEDVEAVAETHKLAVSVNTAKQFIPGSKVGAAVSSIGERARGPAPSTWAIYGYSSEHLFIISGDPAAFPTPMPRPLPVDWAGSVIAGPDGLFYCTDVANSKIVRFDPRTRTPTVLFQDRSLYPADLAFDLDGNLLFSTYGRDGENSGRSFGIWRIPGAEPGATAEKIIDGAEVRECGVLESGCRFGAPRMCVLTVGCYRGDLLVSGKAGVPIARAIGPDYLQIVPFIQEEQPTYMVSADDPIPDVLSDYHQVEATGAVLATDFIHGRILEFDPEGRFVGVFCNLYRANRLTSDYAGNVYASGASWGGRSSLQHIVGFSSDGTRLFEIPINNVSGVIILEE